MKTNQNKKDKKVEIDGSYLLEKAVMLEDEIERLENKVFNTIEEKETLKEYKKLLGIIGPEVDRIIGIYMKKTGAYEDMYYFVKNLAEQGDKECIEELKNMTPKFHKYLTDNTCKN